MARQREESAGESVEALTRAIAAGDAAAFARFYDAWFDAAFAEARRCTRGDEALCLDVVQDAMLRVIRSMRPLLDERALRAWLMAVVRTSAYDRLRRHARRLRRERRWASHAVAEVGAAGADSESTARSSVVEPIEHEALDERLAWLRDQIAALDPIHGGLLFMRFRLGWTLERIGATVGLSPGAVDGRVGRLVAMLRRRARENFDEPD